MIKKLALAVATTMTLCSLSVPVLAKDNDVIALQKSCNGGDLENCYIVGTLYMDGDGVEKDSFSGVKLVEKACEGGVVDACSLLGEVYLTGKGVKANSNQARYYVTKP